MKKRVPNVLIDSKLIFPEDGIFIFHAEGHSEDGISIFVENENMLIVGDNIGDNDDQILPDLESDPLRYKRVLESYLDLKPRLILSGHNQPVGAAYILNVLKKLCKGR